MRYWTILAMALVCFALATGCGGDGPAADDGKTPEELKTGVEKMDKPALEKMKAQYDEAIVALQKKLEEVQKEFGDIPIAEKLGDKSKDLQAEIERIMKEISAQQEKQKVCADALATK